MSVVEKSDEADLRSRYPLYVELGLLASLGLLVLAFNVRWMPKNDFQIDSTEQETVHIKDIQQTQQIEKPPPPPEPQVPVEVPDSETTEDASIDLSADLDVSGNQNVTQGPPPAPDEDEATTDPEVFVAVEQMPKLKGGLSALQRRIEYPSMARKAGIEGRVIVQFVVNENGEVENPRILRGIGAGINEEALRVVKTAEFIPGKQRGKAVPVKMSLPITFSLS